jgi:hypothetical protein
MTKPKNAGKHLLRSPHGTSDMATPESVKSASSICSSPPMRRYIPTVIRRRIFSIGSLLSALLCAATVVLWVRSYWVRDLLVRADHGSYWHFESYEGKLFAGRGTRHGLYGGPAARPQFGWRYYRGKPLLGIVVAGEHWQDEHDFILIPHWAMFGFTIVLPLAWLMYRLLRTFRSDPETCPSCRYCLTGNTSGVCPECGTAVERKVGVSA